MNPDPADTYEFEIATLLRTLAIPDTYGRDRQLTLHRETRDLTDAGPDVYGRPLQLAPATALAWAQMRDAAATEGIVLQPVSGFRSVDYQRRLIENKRARGLPIHEILRSSAAPGYSEHHTGRAVDVTTPGTEPLEEAFELSLAFRWLTRRGAEFRFRMSYPRHNPHGIIYEPWHWLHDGS